jgi:hypothetical protein
MGELEPETARSVFEHCNSCPECGAELAMIITLRSTVVGSERRYGRTWSSLAIAASLVVLIAAGAFFANLIGPGLRTVNDASSGPAAAESALASLATQETLPRGFFELRFGGLVPVDTSERLLQQGLEALVEERFEEADQVLSRRLASSPRDIEASTYLGIARYLQGDLSDETLALLTRSGQSPQMNRIGSWYVGNVLLARGEVAAATLVFESLLDANDRSGRQARAILDRIAASGNRE